MYMHTLRPKGLSSISFQEMWNLKQGEKWGKGEGIVSISDKINMKQKLETEYDIKTALSLYPTGYGIKLFYQTIFFHFKMKADACWLPYRMSHWVKCAGTYVGEKCWHFSKPCKRAFHSAIMGHPSTTSPAPFNSLTLSALEHREQLWQIMTVTLQPEWLDKPPGSHKGPKNSPNPSKVLM